MDFFLAAMSFITPYRDNDGVFVAYPMAQRNPRPVADIDCPGDRHFLFIFDTTPTPNTMAANEPTVLAMDSSIHP